MLAVAERGSEPVSLVDAVMPAADTRWDPTVRQARHSLGPHPRRHPPPDSGYAILDCAALGNGMMP